MWDLEEEILIFWDMNDKDLMLPQLNGKNWKTDLVFMVKYVRTSSNLGVILQGKDFLVHELYTSVQAFKTKWFLFSKQVKENKFTYFLTLQRIYVSYNVANKYSNILSKLYEEFLKQF
jgi:hypothetical protein